ncbi:MAG: putative Se/S carrier-like protein [Clostridia bacterium]|nr:putative Se/S carrier-like protein [Clostridia bacterium]
MYYIVYSSITFATGIKNKFRYDNARITVTHTPSKISGASCSYSLKVNSYEKALEIIKASTEYGVTIRGLYKETKENEFEKITY